MKKFRVKGKVIKVSGTGVSTIATCDVIKEGASTQELWDAWHADMRRLYPQGPDYDVDYHVTVTEEDPHRHRAPPAAPYIEAAIALRPDGKVVNAWVTTGIAIVSAMIGAALGMMGGR